MVNTTTTPLVLVADDEINTTLMVQHIFEREGFRVERANNGIAALESAKTLLPDLILLDIMMPGMNGFDVLRRLREDEQTRLIPTIMMTANARTPDNVALGLNLGADDYVVKPFEPLELVVRVQALLKRYRIAASQTVQLGALVMDRKNYQLTVNGEAVTLPLKEFELLFKLASYPDKTLSRDQLIEDIWGYDFEGNERTLDVHINRLRQRFPEEEHTFRIRTIRGLGYRMEVV